MPRSDGRRPDGRFDKGEGRFPLRSPGGWSHITEFSIHIANMGSKAVRIHGATWNSVVRFVHYLPPLSESGSMGIDRLLALRRGSFRVESRSTRTGGNRCSRLDLEKLGPGVEDSTEIER